MAFLHPESRGVNEHLVAPEETGRTEDLGLHFRIGADERDLNYVNHGDPAAAMTAVEPFTSRSTRQLSLDEMVETLMGRRPELRFDYIQKNARFAHDLDV